MMEAYDNGNGNLRILGEDRRVKWMQTPTKQRQESTLLSESNSQVVAFTLSKYFDFSWYMSKMTSSTWRDVLAEINAELKK